MSKILTAVFDGEVLRPDSTLKLQPDSRHDHYLYGMPKRQPSSCA